MILDETDKLPDHTPPTPQQKDENAIVISIIIKALNEEEHIAGSIESALAALSGIDGEVILADSLSTDRTVEIAKRYPITIMQLGHPEDRCCGAGPQLGYQQTHGEFIYILDGDMELNRNFLPITLGRMESNPKLAGVAGQVEIIGGQGYEFAVRKQLLSIRFSPGAKDTLQCGGLYRRAALESVGYFSNRNLHAYEEKELGLRLIHAGWELERLAVPALKHYVHDEESLPLMWRRWRSRYVDGAGELLRASWGKPYFCEVLRSQLKPIFFVLVWIVLVCSLLASSWSLYPLILMIGAIFLLAILLIVRKKSLKDGLLSLLNLQIYTAGFVRGLLASQVDPRMPIDYKIIAIRHDS